MTKSMIERIGIVVTIVSAIIGGLWVVLVDLKNTDNSIIRYYLQMIDVGTAVVCVLFVLVALLAWWVVILVIKLRSRPQLPSKEEAIRRIDEALALKRQIYGRLKAQGIQEWTHEDLFQISAEFHRLIKDLSRSGSIYWKEFESIDTKYQKHDADAKLRMLELQGVVESLRRAWESGEIG